MAAKEYKIDGQLMQAIVSTLVALPFGQVNNLMQPLMQTLQAQDNAPEAPIDPPAQTA